MSEANNAAKGNGERLAVYLTHSSVSPLYAAALYLCGAAILGCLISVCFFDFNQKGYTQ